MTETKAQAAVRLQLKRIDTGAISQKVRDATDRFMQAVSTDWTPEPGVMSVEGEAFLVWTLNGYSIWASIAEDGPSFVIASVVYTDQDHALTQATCTPVAHSSDPEEALDLAKKWLGELSDVCREANAAFEASLQSLLG